MDKLTEALAKKLANTAKGWIQLDDSFRLADECIRQMEWCRCGDYSDGYGPDLTIAPDDWKPE